MFQQTKVNEKTRPLLVSDKERENCICQNVQNLSYWNRYFVIYPHKCTLNNLKKKYQEKWENAYMTVKNARASRALRQALDPGHYWLASLAWLRFAMSAKSQKKFLGPPLDQILDPLVICVVLTPTAAWKSMWARSLVAKSSTSVTLRDESEALNPKANITLSQKQGYQATYEKDLCLPRK